MDQNAKESEGGKVKPLRVGDRVRHKASGEIGVVSLAKSQDRIWFDAPIGGFFCWNAALLELIPKRKKSDKK